MENIKAFRDLIKFAMLGMLLCSSLSGVAQDTCSVRCPNGSMSETFDCNSNYVPVCLRRTAAPRPAAQPNLETDTVPKEKVEAQQLNLQGIDASNDGDYQKALDYFSQALELQPEDEAIQENRQKVLARIESQRQAKQAAFDQRKSEAIESLKDVSTGGDFDSGLKSVTDTTERPVSGDPLVFDARAFPTGLPKAVEDEIPDTQTGDRVRKGFQAIMMHDWILARAWFQDAENHDPGNMGLKRLVELADYTIKRQASQTSPTKARAQAANTHSPLPVTNGANPQIDLDKILDESMRKDEEEANPQRELNQMIDEGLRADEMRSIQAYNRYYFLKHPQAAAQKPSTESHGIGTSIEEEKMKWEAFFHSLFTPPHMVRRPTSVSGVRD